MSDSASNGRKQPEILNLIVNNVTKTYETNDYSNAKKTEVKSEQKVRGVSFTIG